jgi:hypothetical protein
VPLLEGSIDHNRELGTEVLLAYSLDYLARARIGLRQLPAARALLLEALDRGASMGSGEVVARTLTDVAALAAEVSATEPAARFLGASDTIRGSIGAPVYRPDQTRVAELRGRLRAALGSGRADEVMAAGRALGFEEATDVARTWLSGAALDLGP